MSALSPVLPIIGRCQALFDDLDLNAVKEWKAKAPGRKAIGYLPVYVPRNRFERLLFNDNGRRIREALLGQANVLVADVPYRRPR